MSAIASYKIDKIESFMDNCLYDISFLCKSLIKDFIVFLNMSLTVQSLSLI